MPRFFLSPGGELAPGDGITISGEDARHISRSLRMREGERLVVCDTHCREYDCEIVGFTSEEVLLTVVSVSESLTEPPFRALLYQAYPKGDKLDTIIQKAVELGASEIVPFVSERCIARPDRDKAAKRRERCQRIADEAAKQCGRGILPAVREPVSYESAIKEAASADLALFCYEGEGTVSLARILSECEGIPETVSIVIGSEGGFSPGEVELAVSHGITPIGLGKRILRCETASGYVLACLSLKFEL